MHLFSYHCFSLLGGRWAFVCLCILLLYYSFSFFFFFFLEGAFVCLCIYLVIILFFFYVLVLSAEKESRVCSRDFFKIIQKFGKKKSKELD